MIQNIVALVVSGVIMAIVSRLSYEGNLTVKEFVDDIPSEIKGKWYLNLIIWSIILVVLMLLVEVGLNDLLASILMGIMLGITNEALKERNW